MDPKSFDQILWEAYDDGCRRIEADLRRFIGPLNAWIRALLSKTLPPDWRQRLGAYLDSWEPEGFEVEPDERRKLEKWIENWARLLYVWPKDIGPRIAAERDRDDRPFLLHQAPSVSGPPNGGKSVAAPVNAFADGVELAGPGPNTTASYRAKVQQALQILEPKVALWWRSNSVQGMVRSRVAGRFQSAYYSELDERDQPVIVVDHGFTAGETAQAIVAELDNSIFGDSIGAFYRKHRLGITLNPEEFVAWQQQARGEAARLASVLAEMQYAGIASINPAGDFIVTIADVSENGFRWDQLLSVLPLVGLLPVGAIVLKLRARKIKLPKKLARKLEALDLGQRKSLLAEAAAATTDEEAIAIIERRLAPEHHIATDKNWVSTLRGGPWSPVFEKIFKKAGMTLKDAENRIRIPGHKGPHPEKYHREIAQRLTSATRGTQGAAYKEALLEELQSIATEAVTPGSILNRLLTD